MQKGRDTMIRIMRWKKRKMRSWKKSKIAQKGNNGKKSGKPLGLKKMKKCKLITLFERNKLKREKKFRMSTSSKEATKRKRITTTSTFLLSIRSERMTRYLNSSSNRTKLTAMLLTKTKRAISKLMLTVKNSWPLCHSYSERLPRAKIWGTSNWSRV